MARTLNADLKTAQEVGFPTGGYAPAVRCIFTSKDGGTTYDYSFNPTVTTNRLQHAQQVEERGNDSGVILLSNYDRSVPVDLDGYYVDLGWGHNTASGVLWDTAAGAVAPRLWVMQQSDISGAPKGGRPQLYTLFQLQGVWGAVLNQQPVRLGASPLFRYGDDLEGGILTIPALTNKTIYGVIEYLIETALSAQTGITFTLDPLGTQDDGHIDTDVPFPGSGELMRTINAGSPGRFQTYGELILALLELTKCVLIPRAGLAFKIIYPQASDTVDETYYSSNADGHPFYEVENRRLNMVPNHLEVFGTDPETTAGDWFDPDHYTIPPTRPFTPADIEAAYTGTFMPVTETISEEGLDTNAECDDRAEFYGWQLKDQILGTRLIVPMDARNELYDKVKAEDA